MSRLRSFLAQTFPATVGELLVIAALVLAFLAAQWSSQWHR